MLREQRPNDHSEALDIDDRAELIGFKRRRSTIGTKWSPFATTSLSCGRTPLLNTEGSWKG